VTARSGVRVSGGQTTAHPWITRCALRCPVTVEDIRSVYGRSDRLIAAGALARRILRRASFAQSFPRSCVERALHAIAGIAWPASVGPAPRRGSTRSPMAVRTVSQSWFPRVSWAESGCARGGDRRTVSGVQPLRWFGELSAAQTSAAPLVGSSASNPLRCPPHVRRRARVRQSRPCPRTVGLYASACPRGADCS